MLPRTIVFVLDSLDAEKDETLTWALSLARWCDADLHVVHARRSGRVTGAPGQMRRQELGRIDSIVDRSRRADGNATAAVLPGRPVRAIAGYSVRVGADLVVVTDRPRRRSGYWRTGAFGAALAKAMPSPTLVLPAGLPQSRGSAGPFRSIVTAIDFSDLSLRALSQALVLAQVSGGRLTLVHALDGFPHETVRGGSDALRLGRAFRASAGRINRELQSLIPSDALHWTGVDSTTMLGPAPQAILAQASSERADLVVLGVPRRSRLTDLVAGSTVHKVVRWATSPVLLVPGPWPPGLAPPALVAVAALR